MILLNLILRFPWNFARWDRFIYPWFKCVLWSSRIFFIWNFKIFDILDVSCFFKVFGWLCVSSCIIARSKSASLNVECDILKDSAIKTFENINNKAFKIFIESSKVQQISAVYIPSLIYKYSPFKPVSIRTSWETYYNELIKLKLCD